MADDPTPILGNEVTFSSDISAFGPQVTALADGSFVLAWENGTDIFGRHLNNNGSFTSGDFLSTLSSNDPRHLSGPRVFQQSDGRVVVTYRELLGTNDWNVRWHRVNTDYTPDGNTFPIEDSGIAEFLTDSTARTGGGGAIVYTIPRNDGIHNFTVLRFIDSIGQQASNQIFVGAFSGDTQQNAAVAGLHNGNVVVAYENFDDTTSVRDVRVHIYKPDETDVAGELQLSVNAARNAAFPDIAVLKDGSFVVAWQEEEGIAFSHVSQEGALDRVQVNTVPHSPGGFLPKITALDDVGFIIAWTAGSGSESDGSPNEDIFLQRYGFVNSVVQPVGGTVHLSEPGDQGLFDLSIATLRGALSLFDERVILAYGSETGDATNITTLNYRFVSVPPNLILHPHPCQAEADKLTAAQQKVNNLESRITTLQDELEHGHRPKDQIMKDITTAEKQLLFADAVLEEGQQALQVCLSTQ